VPARLQPMCDAECSSQQSSWRNASVQHGALGTARRCSKRRRFARGFSLKLKSVLAQGKLRGEQDVAPQRPVRRNSPRENVRKTSEAKSATQREGMVTIGIFSRVPVSAMVNNCISCANERLEGMSPSSIQNQVSR
jgi:hypothetical protein